MDAQARNFERDAILRNAEIKRQIDNQIADSYNQQKKQFADGARSLIDQRQQQSKNAAMNERMADKDMVSRDQAIANEIAAQRRMLAAQQKGDQAHVNLQ